MAGSATVKPTNGVSKMPVKSSKNGVKIKGNSDTKTLQDKIDHFEKLKGFTGKRERLVETLTSLNKFIYNQGESVSFHLVDGAGKEFKTSNTELVKIVVDVLKTTLGEKKDEIEKAILEFVF